MQEDLKPLEIVKLNNGIRFMVYVVPKSSKTQISITENGKIKLWLNAPPIDGKANESCIRFIAKIFNLPKSRVNITAGDKSRYKTILVYGEPDILYQTLLKTFKRN